MSKIKKITVSNLKAVSKLTADFGGCTAIITGGNNKGKTTFLKSLPDRIRGKKPELVLKQGEKEGFAELELTTGERFQWQFTDKKEKLVFISEKNIPGSVTKGITQYYFPPVFDIDKFLHDQPAKQKAELQRLTGIDFSEIDALLKNAQDDRLFAGRKAKEEKAKVGFIDWTLPKELYPVDALKNEIAGIEAHNLKAKMVSDKIEEKAAQIAANKKDIEDYEEQIKALQQKITDSKEKIFALGAEISKGRLWLVEGRNKPKENKAELQAKLADLEAKNEAIKENLKAIEQENISIKADQAYEEADAEVKRLEAEKLEVIKNSNMPDGFAFSENGITYNGYELTKEQLSSSGLYIAALKLATLTLGEVKTVHFDASYLDKNSLSEVEAWANSQGLQLLIERPDFDGGDIEYQILQNH